jgi:hypothetical protein
VNAYAMLGAVRRITKGWHEDNEIDADDAMYSIYSILTEEGLL